MVDSLSWCLVEGRRRGYHGRLPVYAEFGKHPPAEGFGIVYRNLGDGIESSHRKGREDAGHGIERVDGEIPSPYVLFPHGGEIFLRGIEGSDGSKLAEYGLDDWTGSKLYTTPNKLRIGTSTTTIYVESSAGINEGGRTGLTSLVTGLLFIVSLVIGPIFIAIPGFAVAPALIFVGFLMAMNVVDINFKNPAESIPAYLCFICMPILYSISDGIGVGVISYVVINLIAGNYKNIKPLMYILAGLFVLKFALF